MRWRKRLWVFSGHAACDHDVRQEVDPLFSGRRARLARLLSSVVSSLTLSLAATYLGPGDLYLATSVTHKSSPVHSLNRMSHFCCCTHPSSLGDNIFFFILIRERLEDIFPIFLIRDCNVKQVQSAQLETCYWFIPDKHSIMQGLVRRDVVEEGGEEERREDGHAVGEGICYNTVLRRRRI